MAASYARGNYMATASVTVPSTGLTADSAQHVISAEPLIMLATVTAIR